MVRAKFKLTKIECSTYSTYVEKRDASGKKVGDELVKQEMRTLVLTPVYSSDPNDENKKFWDASPSGEIRLGTVNPAAWQAFELDRDYYIDFTPAE